MTANGKEVDFLKQDVKLGHEGSDIQNMAVSLNTMRPYSKGDVTVQASALTCVFVLVIKHSTSVTG